MSITKIAAAEAYELGVAEALEESGLTKTAADPGKLKAIMEMLQGLPGKAKSHPGLLGAGGGGALGAGGTALAGGDMGDILAGGLGGAALGGIAGGGAKSLSNSLQGPGANLFERLGLGRVGVAKSEAARSGEKLRGLVGTMGKNQGLRVPSNITEGVRGDIMGAGKTHANRYRDILTASKEQAKDVLSPEVMRAIGLTGGGAGLGMGAYGALGD